jgi:hypothetical protein
MQCRGELLVLGNSGSMAILKWWTVSRCDSSLVAQTALLLVETVAYGISFGVRLCPKDQPQRVFVRETIGLATLLRLVCDTAALRFVARHARFLQSNSFVCCIAEWHSAKRDYG